MTSKTKATDVTRLETGKPLYPRPVNDWRKFLLDANTDHLAAFREFAQRKMQEGKKTLDAKEIYREFCLAVKADCKSEMEKRLGGRSAEERVKEYAENVKKLIDDRPELTILKKEGEAPRIGVKTKNTEIYTHRLYINPRLSAMAGVVDIILETREYAASGITPNLYSFKFISPEAMTSDGKIDCTNFIRPDRIIVSFNETEFQEIKNLIFMLNMEMKGWAALFDERPAFTIPYVYEHRGDIHALSFGLYTGKIRYGKIIADSLSSAYSSLAHRGEFSLEDARGEIEKALPDEIGEPILELLHRLYTADAAKFALEYLQTQREATE